MLPVRTAFNASIPRSASFRDSVGSTCWNAPLERDSDSKLNYHLAGRIIREGLMKICMVGQGAFAKKHLDGLARIKGTEVVTIAGRSPDTTEAVAKKYGIANWTTNVEEAIVQP